MPTKFYPFKTRRTIGPGPRHRKLTRKDDWSCNCKKDGDLQVCLCRGRWKTKDGKPTKAKRTVINDLVKKRAYGKVYRAWLKAKKKAAKRLKDAGKKTGKKR